MALKVRRILRSLRPDIVHTNNLSGFSATIWCEAHRLQSMVIHTIRDYYLLCPRSNMFTQKGECSRPCLKCRFLTGPRRMLSRYVDSVTGISRFVLEKHIQLGLFSDRPTAVIHNPIHIPSTIANSNTSSSSLRIGFIGRIAPSKGLECMLESIACLPPDKAIEVVVAGTGKSEYVKKLKDTFDFLNIRFLGHVAPSSFFTAVDVVIVPSLWNEPFGRVVIEAYAYGIPVVASRRGGLCELITEGKTGYFFNPDDIKHLPEVINKLADDRGKLAAMKQQCRMEAMTFTPERIALQYLRIYSNTISTRLAVTSRIFAKKSLLSYRQ